MFSVDCKLLSLWTDSSFSYDQLPVMLISHYDSFLNFYTSKCHPWPKPWVLQPSADFRTESRSGTGFVLAICGAGQ